MNIPEKAIIVVRGSYEARIIATFIKENLDKNVINCSNNEFCIDLQTLPSTTNTCGWADLEFYEGACEAYDDGCEKYQGSKLDFIPSDPNLRFMSVDAFISLCTYEKGVDCQIEVGDLL